MNSTSTCLQWRRDQRAHGDSNPEVCVQPNPRTQSVLLGLRFCNPNSRFFHHDTKVNKGCLTMHPASDNTQEQRQNVDFWCLKDTCHRKQLSGRACLCYLRTENLEEMWERISNRISTISFCPSHDSEGQMQSSVAPLSSHKMKPAASSMGAGRQPQSCTGYSNPQPGF